MELNVKPIRIIMVRNCRGITGVTGGETYLLQLLKSFNPNKYKCLLVCIVKPELGETSWLQELKKTGFDYITIPVGNPFNFSDIYHVVKLIKEYKANVIHALDHRSDLVSVVSAKITGLPVLASFLGWVNFPKGSWRASVYPWIDRLILKRLDAVITDSVAIGGELKMHKNDPPVVAIRNGIDTQRFDPNIKLIPFKQKQFFQKGEFIFGMVGRIHPVKGHLNFLMAANAVLKSHPDCRFLIVGTVLPGFAFYKQKILDFVDKHNMNKSFLMTHVSQEEIPDVFASLDVLVAPSYAESFSFTLLEGMAMEKAVVTTNVGGASEMITDGKTGYLIPKDDLPALTNKMLMLKENPDKVKAIGKQARMKIIRDFGIKLMANRTGEVYKHLIDYKKQKLNTQEAKERLRAQLEIVSAEK
jgi:glycosyltransferase involved in cell wall biosynthesis